jgi:hypothetical protein
MGLQKYRADIEEKKQPNGAIPYLTRWMGGPSLALIRNCPIERFPISPRTVYVRGEPNTAYTIPAACRYMGKTVTGYITWSNDGQYIFRAYAITDDRFANCFVDGCNHEW